MKGYRTSLVGLFGRSEDEEPTVARIEIPLVQRDYAQGRLGGRADEVRARFVDVLHDAVLGTDAVDLDFVYGDVTNETLRPLDGQQRLTTLFLLHWYFAIRADTMEEENSGWQQFSYATRPSARLFCERLVTNPPPSSTLTSEDWVPSAWIVDQPWYLFVWRNDPTIQAMLVMIDAIHDRFATADAQAAWRRLADPDTPAVSFQLLPIEEMGAGDELYIKMNSRGKPLTEFENFKAQFEHALADSHRAREFAHKIDGAWSDLLWPIHGGDNIVDDEFMRYLEYLTEICEWREGILSGGRLETRATNVFVDSPDASANLAFLFDSLDVWSSQAHIAATFESLFTTAEAATNADTGTRVALFGANTAVDLFEACCHTYGDLRGNIRVFSQAQSLLLYAVLLHVTRQTADFPRRLRALRNLIANSENEIRRDNMPKLVRQVESLVVDGALGDLATFNQVQLREEIDKRTFLGKHPDLEQVVFKLEDHNLLRGSLAVFDLEPSTIRQRAAAFGRVFSDPSCWPALTGALLAVGEYARQPWGDTYYFGTGSKDQEGVWRYLFRNVGREPITHTRDTLTRFLDGLAATDLPQGDYLQEVMRQWLEERLEAGMLDWRYYLVRYDCMREGDSGLYKGLDAKLGYSMVMLRRTRMYSWYRDPYLLAIWRESGVADAVVDPWFTGWETKPRWMELTSSSTRLRSVDHGIAIKPPPAQDHLQGFLAVASQRPDLTETQDGWLFAVSQRDQDGVMIDCEDRVRKGAELLRQLVEQGL